MLLAIVFTLLVTAFTFAITRNMVKNDLISSVFIFMFYMYGYLFDLVSNSGTIDVKHRIFLPLYLIIFYFLAGIINNIESDDILKQIRSKFTIIFTILLAFNIIQVLPKELHKIESSEKFQTSTKNTKTASVSDKDPDIYFIILDEYASSKTIKDIWGYDNSEIEQYLIKKGFSVAQSPVVKYNSTTKAIPSYLNMGYIDKNTDTTTSYNMLNENKVMTKLKELGYTNIAFDSWFSVNPAKGKIHADYNYQYTHDAKVTFLDGLSNLIVNQSMVRPFSYLLYQQYGDIDDYHRNSTVYTFAKLQDVVKMKGPKFVYAHILCPHTPFTFDQNGEPVNINNKYNWKNKKYYLDQYIFVNKQIVKMVDHIFSSSIKPPIIVIQSDHGPRPQFGQNPSTRFTIPEEHMYRIFYTYYLPNGEGKYLPETVDPVNTFKMIIDTYLKAGN